MIGYIEGRLLSKKDRRLIIVANQIGYEVLVPEFVMESLENTQEGDMVYLYIYFHQTERQPTPVLIGFNSEEEKEFFRKFISVGDIGPLKATAAMTIPVSDIASAIENKDTAKLTKLKGIGERTAYKIIAALSGKIGDFAEKQTKTTQIIIKEDIAQQVIGVLTEKLGYKANDAKKMVNQALEDNPEISDPGQLFDKVYKISGM